MSGEKPPKQKAEGRHPPPPPFGAYGRTTVSRMIFSLLPSPESGSGGYEEPVREGIKMKNKSREIINYKESPSPPPPPPFPPPPLAGCGPEPHRRLFRSSIWRDD